MEQPVNVDRVAAWAQGQMALCSFKYCSLDHAERVKALAGGVPALRVLSQHPAWPAMCDVVERGPWPCDYMTDLWWDAWSLNEHPDSYDKFLWCVRENGTHIASVSVQGEATVSSIEKSFSGDARTWYRWTGKTLKRVVDVSPADEPEKRRALRRAERLRALSVSR